MGTTVRVRDKDKEKLERLRAMVTLSSGKRVTQEQLLGTLLDDALARGESFLTETFGPKLPLSDQDFAKIKGLISDWGVVTSSRDIDQILYGSANTGHRKK